MPFILRTITAPLPNTGNSYQKKTSSGRKPQVLPAFERDSPQEPSQNKRKLGPVPKTSKSAILKSLKKKS